MTKQEIIDYANTIAAPKTVGRLKLVLKQFDTVEDFFAASESKGKLSAAYNESRPSGKRGLGEKFYDAVKRIVKKRDEEAMKAEDAELLKAPSVQAHQPDEPPPKPGRFYTIQQLKALVSFMELCGVRAIDLAGVDEFCKVMRFDIFDAMGATKEND